MQLNTLKPAKGSRKKKKLVGRGPGSGHGTYSCKGMKGQRSRAGFSQRPGFEGGRTPLHKQTPKLKGFKSIHTKPEVLNLVDLEKKFKDGDVVDKKKLVEARLISSANSKVKVLGNGELKKKLTIEVDQISKSAKEEIEKSGGVVKLPEVKKAKVRKMKK